MHIWNSFKTEQLFIVGELLSGYRVSNILGLCPLNSRSSQLLLIARKCSRNIQNTQWRQSHSVESQLSVSSFTSTLPYSSILPQLYFYLFLFNFFNSISKLCLQISFSTLNLLCQKFIVFCDLVIPYWSSVAPQHCRVSQPTVCRSDIFTFLLERIRVWGRVWL